MARNTFSLHAPLLSLFLPLLSWLMPIQPGYALNSCSDAYPSAITAFTQGRQSDGSAVASEYSNPEVLFGSTTLPNDQLALGIGGSVTVSFDTPLANYPAAGLPTITRPSSSSSCANAPVRAVISGSIDGLSFTELATLCDGSTFSLGSFPWVSHLRITDATDPSASQFANIPTAGFTLAKVFGQSCLKRSLCASTPENDPSLADPSRTPTLSFGPLGDSWVFGSEATFEEYGNGSARLKGEVVKLEAPSQRLNLVVSFTGRTDAPPGGSPIRLLYPSAYIDKGGPIDPSLWYYYRALSGALFTAANDRTVLRSALGSTRATQLGIGANGHNGSLGVYSDSLADDGSAQGESTLAFNLHDCPATPPTPTPPVGEDESSPITAQTCQSLDKTDTLAELDQALLLRKESVFRATRILVRSQRTKANSAFRARARSTTRNLVVAAWRAIWEHPWQIRSCSLPWPCSPKSLAPMQSNIAAAIDVLDAHVSKTLRSVVTRVKARKARSQLNAVLTQHRNHSQRFKGLLGTLPVETYECPM